MELIVLFLALLMFIAFYLRANYYIRAYYLFTEREFKGWLIPYRSISSFKEQLLLIPFLPYFYERNERNIQGCHYVKIGSHWNYFSVFLLIMYIGVSLWAKGVS
jgi:hypothetical protein